MEMENFKLQCAACGKLGTGSHGAFRGTSRPIPKTLRIDIGSPRREDGALNERICHACRERNRTIIKCALSLALLSLALPLSRVPIFPLTPVSAAKRRRAIRVEADVRR